MITTEQPNIDQTRTIRVAAVQMESKNGQIKTNLEHGTSLVEQAAQQGAQLILLPELMPTGYLLTGEIWEAAEPIEGPTSNWLRTISKRLGVWVGTSFLEAEEEDFYNTFVITTPDGEVAGHVRKQFPAIWEAYFFKGEASSHVINTSLGKIGVGICFDSHLAEIAQLMQEQSVDLVLMPHCYPIPLKPSKLVSEKDIERQKKILREMAPLYAHLLGVPAVVANKSGLWFSPAPLTLLPGPTQSRFPGLSTIADSDGSIKARLGDEEGVIVATVTLDPSRKITAKPPRYSRWIYPGPAVRKILGMVEAMGRFSYTRSAERKKIARVIAAAVESEPLQQMLMK